MNEDTRKRLEDNCALAERLDVESTQVRTDDVRALLDGCQSMVRQRDLLGEAIGRIAIKCGILRPDHEGCTGPQLMMLADNVLDHISSLQSRLSEVEKERDVMKGRAEFLINAIRQIKARHSRWQGTTVYEVTAADIASAALSDIESIAAKAWEETK